MDEQTRAQIEAVRRMQDYIEAHLSEEITLQNLADASANSPFYAHRLFVRWLTRTPAEYIRRLRLSRSALRLRDERVKVLDVALESGFHSVDGYQRAFQSAFGVNPRAYARQPIPIWLFRPYGIEYETQEEKTVENVKSIFIQAVDKPARKAIIKRGVKAEEYFDYCAEVGCDVWGLLMSIPSLGGEPVCLWLPDAMIAPGTSRYVQGAEVAADYAGEVPEGFDLIDLPAAKYLMFQGEPFAEEQYGEAIAQVQQAMCRYDPTPAGYAWDDENPRIQLEPVGARGYIELRAVKSKE